MKVKKNMLTTEEVAKELNVSTSSVKRYANQGYIEKVKYPSGAVRYPLKSILALKKAS